MQPSLVVSMDGNGDPTARTAAPTSPEGARKVRDPAWMLPIRYAKYFYLSPSLLDCTDDKLTT